MHQLAQRMLRVAPLCRTMGVSAVQCRTAAGGKEAIKDLRAMTNAGLMDCKKALAASNGDLDAAAKWLEERGIAKAGKKKDRVAASGLVAVLRGAQGVCVVELNSESDFVAKTDAFKKIVADVHGVVTAIEQGTQEVHADLFTAEALNAHPTLSSAITTAIATTGENIVLRRAVYFPTPENGAVGAYVHNKASGLPTAGLTCAVASVAPEPVDRPARDVDVLRITANQIAQHVVAESLSEDNSVPLREQKFMQSERTVGGHLKAKAKEAGCKKIEVAATLLWRCGEGIEVDTTSFADEVESMTKASQA